MNNAVIKSIKSIKEIPKNKPVVIALSGGVDSMVLFDALNKNKYAIVIAHVNHKQREESDDEYRAIKALAEEHGYPFEGLVLDDDLSGNFQFEARKKRRNFFKSVADKYNTNVILTAHHLDDQIETLLMRLTKGYDITTLKGIQQVQEDGEHLFIRPFIALEKSVLIHYAQHQNLTYYEDATNDEPDYMRNRIRQSVVSLLLEENPNLHASFQQTLSAFADLSLLVEATADTFLSKHKKHIPIQAFLKENRLVQQQIIKTLIRKKTHTDHPISQPHLTMIIDQLMTSSNNLVHPITDTVAFHKEYDVFFIANRVQSEPLSITISQEGLYPINTYTAYRVTQENLSHIYSNYMVLWYNETVFPLYLRTREPGDKILCSYGHKKLKSLLIDKKIPPSKRQDMIVLANDKEVLWIPFLKMSCHQDNTKPKKLYIYEVPLC